MKIKRNQLSKALKYNLDHRRCGESGNYLFKKHIDMIYGDEILLIVQVLTKDVYSSVTSCSNSSEYFIDFIVEF